MRVVCYDDYHGEGRADRAVDRILQSLSTEVSDKTVFLSRITIDC